MDLFFIKFEFLSKILYYNLSRVLHSVFWKQKQTNKQKKQNNWMTVGLQVWHNEELGCRFFALFTHLYT